MSFFSWLRKRTSTRSTRWDGLQIRPTAPRFRPRLEALEDRWLPSTFYAATASDLIADIKASNLQGGANTIVLTAPTTSPYVLTAVDNTTDGATGAPVIAPGDTLTIQGNGDTIERSTAILKDNCGLQGIGDDSPVCRLHWARSGLDPVLPGEDNHSFTA